jgi:hypothetical protein
MHNIGSKFTDKAPITVKDRSVYVSKALLRSQEVCVRVASGSVHCCQRKDNANSSGSSGCFAEASLRTSEATDGSWTVQLSTEDTSRHELAGAGPPAS